MMSAAMTARPSFLSALQMAAPIPRADPVTSAVLVIPPSPPVRRPRRGLRREHHRPVAGDSPQADGIKVLARAHQDLIWARTRPTNQVRNALREYYPAARETFDDLADRDTLAILGRAPTPTVGARLTLPQIRTALKAGGRRRYLDQRARQIQEGLRTAHLAAPDAVVPAYASTVAALVRIIAETTARSANSKQRSLPVLNSIRTPLSTCLSQDSVLCSAPGRSISVRGRARPLHQRQVTQELHRDVAHNRGIRPQTHGHGPSRTQPAPIRRHRPVGVLFPHQQCRHPRLLRPATSGRRPPPPSPTSPRSLLIIGFGELVVLGVVGLVGACGVGVLGRLMAVAGFFGGGGRVLGF